MIDGKAHADPVIYISRKIITNIYIVKTADIDAINARGTSPDVMRINPACLAEIVFGNRRIRANASVQLRTEDQFYERHN